MAAVSRRWRSSNDLQEVVDHQLWERDDRLTLIGEAARSQVYDARADIRRQVGEVPLFELAAIAHAVVYRTEGRWARSVPADAQYVFAGLSTRAISTLREIGLLLEQGYSFGARSRWRTLSEILVVARVLALGDRHSFTRYRLHRWIMLKDQRVRTGDSTWVSDEPTPEVMAARLRRRFGKDFDSPYGWAARITFRELRVIRPNWTHLRKLAETDEHDSRVHDAHHAVHGADALGLLGTVDAGYGMFHSGSSASGVLEVTRDSVRLFRQTLWALFEGCLKFSNERRPQILQSIVDGCALNLEENLGWRIVALDPVARDNYLSAISDLLGPAGLQGAST